MVIIDIREYVSEITVLASWMSMSTDELQQTMVSETVSRLGFVTIVPRVHYTYPREVSDVVITIQRRLEKYLYRLLRPIDPSVADYSITYISDGILKIEGF